MNILYIGDVMGEVGLEVVEEVLPTLINEEKIDLVIAQAENVTGGKGTSIADFKRLLKAGVDFCSGGNWSLTNREIYPALQDPKQPIIRPANYPEGTPGLGQKLIAKNGKTTLVASLQGKIVGKDAGLQLDNPLKVIDKILSEYQDQELDAIVVNFHGDYSSEKVIIGHYLDGRVNLVVGDHWHVPTADARILPRGTAHITDIGMCGALNASLGISLESVLPRWRDNIKTKNLLETNGPRQFNAVLINCDKPNRTNSIKQIQKTLG
ncbi:MAG TPA: TIGR00282 family metallophosphoesterase [Candidatus Sulfotelmatobacter sp.]|nr:TIGR00282 family metallophosphoesterase [Candidatus Sulfotelmatobacter sp.]